MNEINGKWYPYDDEIGNTLHRCNGEKTSTLEERVLSLEKIVRQLNDKIYLQQEQIAELRKGRI